MEWELANYLIMVGRVTLAKVVLGSMLQNEKRKAMVLHSDARSWRGEFDAMGFCNAHVAEYGL